MGRGVGVLMWILNKQDVQSSTGILWLTVKEDSGALFL